MTVKELIEKLQKLPPDLRIMKAIYHNCSGGFILDYIDSNDAWLTHNELNEEIVQVS